MRRDGLRDERRDSAPRDNVVSQVNEARVEVLGGERHELLLNVFGDACVAASGLELHRRHEAQSRLVLGRCSAVLFVAHPLATRFPALELSQCSASLYSPVRR